MEFKLDENQETEIKTYVLNVVRDAIKQATTSSKPYLIGELGTYIIKV